MQIIPFEGDRKRIERTMRDRANKAKAKQRRFINKYLKENGL